MNLKTVSLASAIVAGSPLAKGRYAIGEGLTKKFPADSAIVPSLILGTEIFYFHDAYYRGLIGRTLVLHRTLPADEVAALAK